MAKSMRDYLTICLDQYRKVAISKYGGDFDWQSIEQKVSKDLGLINKQVITCSELRFFRDEALWPFGKFACLPADEELKRALELKRFDFRHISPNRETNLFRELLSVLRSIDLVSIVLRFVRPDRYGVISPPVEQVLDLRRGSDAVQTYRYYLEDLSRLKMSSPAASPGHSMIKGPCENVRIECRSLCQTDLLAETRAKELEKYSRKTRMDADKVAQKTASIEKQANKKLRKLDLSVNTSGSGAADSNAKSLEKIVEIVPRLQREGTCCPVWI